MSTTPQYVIRSGETGHDDYTVDVTPESAGWGFCGLKVLELPPNGKTLVDSNTSEYLILPLTGSCAISIGKHVYQLKGRTEVWTSVSDCLYVPRDTSFTISSPEGGRFALSSATATKDLPVRYCPVTETRIELRGAGASSRQINNYALGNDLETDHLLVCEVLTPGGNWSSYPPHKHDTHNANERELEEIYYFEVRHAANGSEGFALQRVYSSPDHPIDICTEIHSGDVITMPWGYHGPSIAAPGYDLYYLNVMAGPAEDHQWLMTDDPEHHWIRKSWENQKLDPRLPMTVIPEEET